MPVSKSIRVPTTSNVSVLKSRSLTASPRATSRSGYDDTRSVTHQNMPLPQPVSFHTMKGTSENASRAKFRELRLDELRRIHLPKLSEKPRGRLWRSPTDRREGSFRPISPSSYRPDPRSKQRSYPFRTVSENEFCELRLYGVLGSSLPLSVIRPRVAARHAC